METEPRRTVLLTGATGYIGGRLLPLLEASGWRVRCLARNPEHLRSRVSPETEVVAGDVLKPETLDAAMEGVHTAYYLVHSMGYATRFEEVDALSARNFAQAAARAGVKRIIYLGGLGDPRTGLSPHLRSRQEVGEILRESGAQVIEFRASVIIGSGSLSFEMVRALVERLPVMVTPRWVSTPAQPIAIADVERYLIAALNMDIDGSSVFEIGGRDIVSYAEIMREYAGRRGLRRVMLPVPFLTPRLSSLWLHLVTPLFARVGRRLIEGVRNATVVQDHSALHAFPDIRPVGIGEAITAAMLDEDHGQTKWCDAMSSCPAPRREGSSSGNRVSYTSETHVNAPPDAVFQVVQRAGGKHGWFFATWLWRLRGFLDVLMGGVGSRRGRRDEGSLRAGDVVDWWRVEQIIPDRLLRLQGEMNIPGRHWLQFEITPDGDGSLLRQTAIFDPVGLRGLAYWYLLYPIHAFVFARMLSRIARIAEGAR